MQPDQLVLYVDGLKAFAGVLFAVVSLTIYWKMREDGEVAMSEFQLHEEQVLKDAHIILYANVFGAVGMLGYTLVGPEIVPLFVGTILRTLYMAVIMYVLVKWAVILK